MLYPWLVLLRLQRTNIILQLITVAVFKACSEPPYSKKLHHIEISQSIYWFLHDTSFH